MKHLWLPLLIGLAAASLAVELAQRHVGDAMVVEFFWSVKSELFGGLFTVSGLLLSVKTYIVVKLKEGVYSSESYLNTYLENFEAGRVGYTCQFEPLRRLSGALTCAVGATTVAAVLILISAAIGSLKGAFLGFGSAGAALGALVFCWIRIRQNLESYFEILTKENGPRLEAAKKRFKEKASMTHSLEEAEAALKEKSKPE